jgi:anti-sigma-K factor RskA
MEADTVHDLTAAYALDALDTEDAREYEAHLARCERCRTDLAALSDAAAALAYATDSPAPPPELRARILQQAVHERENVVPLHSRWLRPLVGVAAVAACAALALGIWAATLSSELDDKSASVDRQQRVAAILAQPDAETISFPRGTLVVTPSGQAALILRNLEDAGPGRTYEAWIGVQGKALPAGLFDGGDVVALPLDGRVPEGALVMVTEETEGGVATPTSEPFIRVENRQPS